MSRAREFWDERADEHAFYAVDNRIDEQDPDLDGFWQAGKEDFDRLLASVGTELERWDEVVEIGCGGGRLTRVISERVTSVRALDVSERMLELAKGHNPHLDNVDWLLGDGQSLAGIDSDSADVVISHVVFQHIPDPEVTLGYVREIGRALRPGGWAAFQISNDPSVHEHRRGRERVRRAVRALTGRGPKGQAAPEWRGSAVGLERVT